MPVYFPPAAHEHLALVGLFILFSCAFALQFIWSWRIELHSVHPQVTPFTTSSYHLILRLLLSNNKGWTLVCPFYEHQCMSSDHRKQIPMCGCRDLSIFYSGYIYLVVHLRSAHLHTSLRWLVLFQPIGLLYLLPGCLKRTIYYVRQISRLGA